MKFKTSVLEIKRALAVLSPITNHNHQTLAFRYILIRQKDDVIEFKGFDDSTVGSAFISYTKLEGDTKEAYVLAKHLRGLVNKFAGDEISFTITDDSCKIAVGRSRYSLNSLDPEVAKESLEALDIDYYSVFVSDEDSIPIKVDKFTTAYSSISHCLSKDTSTKILQNIFFKQGKMLACDGVRGAAVEFKVDFNDVMFHKKICDCIMSTNESEVRILIAGDRVYGGTSNSIFVSMISEEYPIDKIWDIINNFHEDVEYPIDMDVEPDEINDKLGRILLFADGETNAVGLINDTKTLKLVVNNNSSAEEYITIFKQNGEPSEFEIYLDGKSFKEALTKSLTKTRWVAQSSDDIQYVYDGSLLQFFNGLDM